MKRTPCLQGFKLSRHHGFPSRLAMLRTVSCWVLCSVGLPKTISTFSVRVFGVTLTMRIVAGFGNICRFRSVIEGPWRGGNMAPSSMKKEFGSVVRTCLACPVCVQRQFPFSFPLSIYNPILPYITQCYPYTTGFWRLICSAQPVLVLMRAHP